MAPVEGVCHFYCCNL